MLRAADGRPAKLTILILDLDGFKEVNDSLGHATGDMLLIQVAERLRSCVRPIDTVARLGGDEFAVLIADKSSERDGTLVANRITKALGEPFKLEGREIEVGASIGIAATDQDVEDADHLLRNADLAMYRAKATGAGGFERYHPRLHVALVESCSSRPSCGRPSPRTTWSCTTSRRCRSRPARSRASRRSRAGSTRAAATSRRPSSSRWPSRPD